MLRRILGRAGLAGLLWLIVAGTAWSQQERVTVKGSWIAQCRADAAAGRSCEVQAIHDVRKPPLANYWLAYGLRERVFTVTGAPCPATARLWIDRHPAMEFESCGRCACRMRTEDSARLFEQARSGKTLFLEVKDNKGVALGPYETRLRDFEKSHRAAAAATSTAAR
jgi:hypothetical protein